MIRVFTRGRSEEPARASDEGKQGAETPTGSGLVTIIGFWVSKVIADAETGLVTRVRKSAFVR